MRLTLAALVLGVGLMLIAAFTGNEPAIFILPKDSAALATYNSMQYWRTVLSVIGAVIAAIAFVKWMTSASHRFFER